MVLEDRVGSPDYNWNERSCTAERARLLTVRLRAVAIR